jgi:hypothetical protein
LTVGGIPNSYHATLWPPPPFRYQSGILVRPPSITPFNKEKKRGPSSFEIDFWQRSTTVHVKGQQRKGGRGREEKRSVGG